MRSSRFAVLCSFVALLVPITASNVAAQEEAKSIEGQTRISQVTFTTVDCPVEEAFLPQLGAIVLPKLVDKGLDFLAGWLEKKKEAKNGSSSARGAAEFFCPDGQTVQVSGFSFTRKRKLDGNSEAIDFQADFTIHTSADRAAFRSELTNLVFQATSAKKPGSGRKDILMTGIFESPFADARSEEQRNAAALGVFQLSLEQVEIGSTLTFDPPITGQWIPVPQRPEDDENGEGEGEEATPEPPPYTGSFSLLMNVQESEDAGDLLLKAIEAFSETKDDLSSELSKVIKDALGVEGEDDDGDDD